MTLPLRDDDSRLKFCDDFFEAVDAKVVYQSDDYREYELPRDVDKELTDRPYYWMWVEKTGQQVLPTILRLAFSSEAVERENQRLRAAAIKEAMERGASELELRFLRPPMAEYVALGSFRLQKICESVERRGKFAAVGISSDHAQDRMVPWLMVNFLISSRCDLVSEEFLSLAVCLINGQVVQDFYRKIEHLPVSRMSAETCLKHAKLTLNGGFDCLYKHVERDLAQRPTDWALSAKQRMMSEVKQLNTYYDSIMPSLKEEERAVANREKVRKIEELTSRVSPRIEVAMTQAALIGLPERSK